MNRPRATNALAALGILLARNRSLQHGAGLLASLLAGGIGIDLTGASVVIHYDRWWNPAVEDQATDRAYRIGQVSNVQVHKFITVGTLEEMIDEMIENTMPFIDKGRLTNPSVSPLT